MKLKIPEKTFLKSESRTSVTFKLQFLILAIYQWQRLGVPTWDLVSLQQTVCYHEKIVKNTFYIFYNLNVREILVSDFKNDFSGNLNFTVGILSSTHLNSFAQLSSIFWFYSMNRSGSTSYVKEVKRLIQLRHFTIFTSNSKRCVEALFDKYEAEKYIDSLKDTKMKEIKAENVYLKESFLKITKILGIHIPICLSK